MALPLNAPPPGGFLMEAQRLQNALKKQNLENQYYGPNIESEINNRNALTKGKNIENEYLPEKLKLANAFQGLQNQYYGPNIESEMANRNALTKKYNTMTPLEAEELRLKNSLYTESTKADIANKEAMTKWRSSGGMSGGVGQKERLELRNQIKVQNPEWDDNKINDAADAYIEGGNTFSDGTPLPPLKGQMASIVGAINKRASTANIQNQAASMDVLAEDLNDIDIEPVTKFAGPKGKIEFVMQAKNMALGLPVSEDFRKYLAFKNVTSNFAMDALRKGFGTSVVPEYVYATLGKASNPNSTFWNDPDQVRTEWNTTKEYVNKNAERLKKKARLGASANISENKSEKTQSNSLEKPIKLKLENGKLVRVQ